MKASRGWRDIAPHARAAFVADDLDRVEPWVPWGIEVRRAAQLPGSDGRGIIRLIPERIVAWGADTDPHVANARDASR